MPKVIQRRNLRVRGAAKEAAVSKKKDELQSKLKAIADLDKKISSDQVKRKQLAEELEAAMKSSKVETVEHGLATAAIKEVFGNAKTVIDENLFKKKFGAALLNKCKEIKLSLMKENMTVAQIEQVTSKEEGKSKGKQLFISYSKKNG